MNRIFVSRDCITEDRVSLTGAVRQHLADSLRVRAGGRFLATDGEGVEYLLEAESVGRQELIARILEEERRPPEPGRGLTLAISPPKAGRMEIAVEKAVECGTMRPTPR